MNSPKLEPQFWDNINEELHGLVPNYSRVSYFHQMDDLAFGLATILIHYLKEEINDEEEINGIGSTRKE